MASEMVLDKFLRLWRPLVLFSALWLSVTLAIAEDHPIAIIENLNEPFDLNPYVEFIEDPDRTITYEALQAGDYDDRWQRNKERYFVGRNSKSRYWFRITVQYQGDFSALKPVLYIRNQAYLLQEFAVWLPGENNVIRKIETGILRPFSQRDISSTQYAFRTPLELTSYTIVGCADQRHISNPVRLPFFLLTKQQFTKADQQTQNIVIAFYAIMGALFLYNTFLLISLKQSIYGFYLLFLLGAIIICTFNDGTNHAWFGVNSSWLINQLFMLNASLMMLFYLLFVRTALDGIYFSSRLATCFRLLILICFIMIACSPFTNLTTFVSAIFQLTSALILTVTLIAVIAAVRQRLPTAAYLLVAEITIICGASIYMLMIQGVLPVSTLTLWSLHASYLSEALLLSLALGARTRVIQQSAIQNLQKYEALYEESIEGLFQFNLLDNALQCNTAMARIFSYSTKEELINSDTTENETQKLWSNKELVDALFANGCVTDYEVPILSRVKQQQVWVAITMQLINDDQGQPMTIDGTMIDITERKLREESQKNYKKLYDNSPQGLFTVSLHDWKLNCNNAYAQMHGFSDANSLLENSVTPGDINLNFPCSNEELFKLLLKEGKIRNLEQPSQKTNTQNHTVWFSLSMDLHRDENGKPDFIEGSIFDITERKLKEETEKQKLQLITQNQAKSEFFASMSHELRTPLTAILGYSEAALDENADVEFMKNATKRIFHSGKHLLEIIDDLLGVSKDETEKLTVAPTQVYLLPLLDEVRDTIDVLAQNKGLSLTVDYHFPLPKIINSDATRVKQILLNLCGNALKFTEKGGVTIDVQCDSEQQQLIVAIKDTGIGLTLQQIENLFAAFMQADASTSRHYGGTGLGLHISKQLALKLGGDIAVTSTYGEGSTFTLTVATDSLQNTEWLHELSYNAMVDHPTIQVPQLRGQVLYAEDNVDNQRLVKNMVEQTGATITLVSNGKKALEYCAHQTFDLILTDVRMPIIDGIELTKLLLEKNKDLPIIAITATLTDKEIIEFESTGFKYVLRKPIDREALYAALQEYMPMQSDAAIHQALHQVRPLRPMNRPLVLLAEDHFDNQQIIAIYLKKIHAEIVIVENGLDALNTAFEKDFDLILMDMQMPIMDGITAVKSLRAKGYQKPIYALTANNTEEAIQVCLNAGCNGHLAKPLDTVKLTALIHKIAMHKNN